MHDRRKLCFFNLANGYFFLYYLLGQKVNSFALVQKIICYSIDDELYVSISVQFNIPQSIFVITNNEYSFIYVFLDYNSLKLTSYCINRIHCKEAHVSFKTVTHIWITLYTLLAIPLK